MGNFSQEDYQSQILAGIDGTDDDSILSIEGNDDTDYEEDDVERDDIDNDEGVDDSEESPDDSETSPAEKVGTYNKDAVSKIVRTRVATYEKRLSKMAPFKNAVDKICEITGLDTNSLVARLEAMSEAEQAQILGLTPEQVRANKIAQSQLKATESQNKTLQRQMDFSQLKADKRFSDVDLFKEEIEDMLDDNPRMSVKQAYLAVKGEIALTAAERQGEERAKARQVINSQKRLVKSGPAAPAQKGPKISNEIIAAARKVGMDPAEYAAYQNVDNLDSYRNIKKKK